MTTLLIGYAIGTLQILLIEWVRGRVRHRRHLRILRAELRRAGAFKEKFNWDPSKGPRNDKLPRPPTLSPKYADYVTETDFSLTDEHRDDNTQEALLGIMDGCSGLEHYINRVNDALDKLRAERDPQTLHVLKSGLLQLVQAYDRELGKLLFVIQSALADLDRRLAEARNWPQLKRAFRRLPVGSNPPPLTDDDPRLNKASAE